MLLERPSKMMKKTFKKNLNMPNSGGTGLGPDDVTTRFGLHNVFDRYKRCSEVIGLFKILQYSYLQYVCNTTS